MADFDARSLMHTAMSRMREQQPDTASNPAMMCCMPTTLQAIEPHPCLQPCLQLCWVDVSMLRAGTGKMSDEQRTRTYKHGGSSEVAHSSVAPGSPQEQRPSMQSLYGETG